MRSIVHIFRNYAVFRGRASRAEFWTFQIFLLVVAVALSAVEGRGIIAGQDPTESVLFDVFLLTILVPTIAVSTRRLHDIGRSGWWSAASEATSSARAPSVLRASSARH